MIARTRGAELQVSVWDGVQRLLHWTLAASVAVCWLVGEEALAVHLAAGYVALAAVLARIVWGAFGSLHARFSSFVRSPASTLAYARDLMKGRAGRYLGHNPLGGWMIVAMLLCVIFVCATGIAYTTDRFWGMASVEAAHRLSSRALMVLVAFHLGGVALMSWHHRENLVRAMLTGRKRLLTREIGKAKK